MRSLFLVPFLLLACRTFAETKVEQVDYHGWKGCWKLSNPDVELVVVPQVGRVMFYGYRGGANVLWENDALSGVAFKPEPGVFRNYGGDKLWLRPEPLWVRLGLWTPDAILDTQPWKSEPITNGVRLISQVGSYPKVQFKREITLAPVGSEVTFQNGMENKGERLEMAIWQDTQVDSPTSVVLPIDITSAQGQGWFGFGNNRLQDPYQVQRTLPEAGASLILKRNPKEGRRFGARSLKGKITVTSGATKFVTESPAFARVPYPDMNSAQRVWLPQDDNFASVGHLGPLTRMARGESVLLTVRWRLERG